MPAAAPALTNSRRFMEILQLQDFGPSSIATLIADWRIENRRLW
jgi:hypothetical protein